MYRYEHVFDCLRSLLDVATANARLERLTFVKEHLGRYLRMALAAAIMHQPADPINFIANHLLQQRHAELTNRTVQIRQQLVLEQRNQHRMDEELAAVSTANPCHPCAPDNFAI